jgi:rhodanese-related sulfurtransferase
MKVISAIEAKELLEKGAVLIDVREPDEHRREKAPGALSVPLSSANLAPVNNATTIYHCKSGFRTSAHIEALTTAAMSRGCEPFLLEGGLEAWKAAGLPVVRDARAPLELIRQVQIAAGALALLGFTLGVLVHPAFHVKSGFVAAGLVLAGVTGWCGMAKLLAVMPWNRRAG